MIEFLLAIGGIWFWTIAIVFSIIVVTCLETESFCWVILFSSGTLGIFIYWGSGMDLFTHYKENPVDILIHFGGYFLAGAAYSIAKWFSYISKKKRDYNEEKRQFLEKNAGLQKGNEISDELKKEWQRKMGSYSNFINKLMPHSNKEKLSFWILYWPWSLIWTIIDDPIRRIVQRIRNLLNSVYEKITTSAFADIEDDLK